MTEQEILAILELPKEDQENALWGLKSFDYYCCLADLAFRLRNEVATQHSQYWRTAKSKVSHKVWGHYHDYTWDELAQPIHWIIAALIVKVKEDE